MYTLYMLQEIKAVCKLKQPLVTNMGLSYDIIVKSTAAKFLAFDSPAASAQSMYDSIEDSLETTDVKWEDRRKFWEDVIKEMTIIDQKFSLEVGIIFLFIIDQIIT